MNTNDLKHKFGRVGVLYGGVNAEREVSIMSGENVMQALLMQGVDAFPVIIGDDPVRQLANTPMDRAFVVLHGKLYEDGCIQGVLDLLKIPYPGSGVLASALNFDKIRCKMFWQANQIPTPPFMLLQNDVSFTDIEKQLGLPFVIKPATEGSSLGVHIIKHRDEFASAIDDVRQYQGEAFAEQYIEGGEYTVGVLNNEPLPAIKIETPDNPFYNYHAKYFSDNTRYLIPSGLSTSAESQLQNYALAAFTLTQCRDWGRVDAMQDKQGQFWMIDLNTLPGMTTHSLLPKAAAYCGLDFANVLVKILSNTLKA